jgi:hypothetical protein
MLPAVQHLCSQLQPLNQESGSNATVQCRDPIRKDSYQCSRALPIQWPRELIPPERLWTILPNSWKPRQLSIKRLQQWWKRWLTTSSAASEYHGSYIVTRVITSSAISCRRFCNAQEWIGHAPHTYTCTCSLTAGWNNTSKRLRSICERSSHQTHWGTRLPIILLAYRASTHDIRVLTPANLLFQRELHLPCDLLSGEPPYREQPTINHTTDLVDQLHNIHNYAH